MLWIPEAIHWNIIWRPSELLALCFARQPSNGMRLSLGADRLWWFLIAHRVPVHNTISLWHTQCVSHTTVVPACSVDNPLLSSQRFALSEQTLPLPCHLTVHMHCFLEKIYIKLLMGGKHCLQIESLDQREPWETGACPEAHHRGGKIPWCIEKTCLLDLWKLCVFKLFSLSDSICFLWIIDS